MEIIPTRIPVAIVQAILLIREIHPTSYITITNNNRLRKNGHVNFYSSVYNNACGTLVANTLRQISLYCINARSLKSKSAAFVDLVCDIKADIFTICETWLTINDSTVLNVLRPPGYKTLLHCPRTKRTGGTALRLRDGIDGVKVFLAEKSSFEVSEWLSMTAIRLRVIVVYRLPYSTEHPISSSAFINELSDYLESVVMSSEPLIINGNFNFHMDVSHDSQTIHFSDLLDSMGLVQHVKQPTHENHTTHTVDLIITRECNNIITKAKEPLPERYFFDHAAVICELTTARPVQKVKHAEYRKPRSIEMQEFVQDFHNSNLCIDSPSLVDVG